MGWLSCYAQSEVRSSFTPGEIWLDADSDIINAHGGGVLCHEGKYYWFGEHKWKSNAAHVGVTCYSSSDLYNWKYEGVAFAVSEDPDSPVVKGCTIERPKVIYNKQTGKYVMYFHLELKGRGYGAAYVAVAVSDRVAGPYELLRAGRVNEGKYPLNMTEAQRNSSVKASDFEKWWTPEWREAINDGLFLRRDLESGQMSRDMTLYVDDDNKAYHIYSSEDNLTLHIAELTDDYLNYTGQYIRVEPGGHNEAPAIFKKDGRYFMITSGCTGWAPNAAHLLTADHILGEWTLHPNPCRGEGADLTFHSQSTYIIPVQGKKDAFIYMGDRWRPKNPVDGRYVWLPIQFENGLPVLEWFDEWTLDIFDQTKETK
ncbi:glycoside hydrolase family 43 protein [Bacteroidales bacterium OttesenSCG-928-L03]|nr:glycoside hydrolase family 43 protein [Bacteroidales bacterium OttesenSCG-928-L03]